MAKVVFISHLIHDKFYYRQEWFCVSERCKKVNLYCFDHIEDNKIINLNVIVFDHENSVGKYVCIHLFYLAVWSL